MGITFKALVAKSWNFLLPLVVFFFDPNQAKMMLALLSLMIFDTLAGGYYYYNIGGHDKRAFLRGFLAKFFKYFGALAGARLLEYFLIGIPYADQLDTYILAFLAMTEFKSFYSWLHKFGLSIPMPPKVQNLFIERKVKAPKQTHTKITLDVKQDK